MKKLLVILSLILFVASFDANAQIRWPFGSPNEITVTSDDTIDIGSSVQRGLNYINFDTDTNIVFEATSLSSSLGVGELLFIEATENGVDADTLTYGTGMTGLLDPIPSGKTRVVTFIFNGTAWVKQSSEQID